MNNTSTTKETILKKHYNTINCLVQLPNNKLASGSADNRIIIWNTFDWSIDKILHGHDSLVWCLVLIGENKIASGSSDNSIIIWDYDKGIQLNVLMGHSKRVCSIAVLPNGTSLASCSVVIGMVKYLFGK